MKATGRLMRVPPDTIFDQAALDEFVGNEVTGADEPTVIVRAWVEDDWVMIEMGPPEMNRGPDDSAAADHLRALRQRHQRRGTRVRDLWGHHH